MNRPDHTLVGVPPSGGHGDGTFDLEERYRRERGTVFMTGLQGLVRVIIDQMRTDRRHALRSAAFVSGYPGSPLAGLDRELQSQASLLAELDIVAQPGLNEELAATAVMGTQRTSRDYSSRFDGVVGFWYGKAPGLDRATDAIRHANYFGVPRTGGALAYVGDDSASKSSTLPSSSEHLLADLNLPTLCPGSVQDVLDFGLHGVAISRASGLWTALKIVTGVADGAGTAEVSPDRILPVLPDSPDGKPLGMDATIRVSFANLRDAERQIAEVRLPTAAAYGRLNGLNRIEGASQARLGIVVPAYVYPALLLAFKRLGLNEGDLIRLGIRLLRLGMIHPIDRGLIREFGRQLEEIVVVEERRPFVEPMIRDALYGMADAPRVLGKQAADGTALISSFGVLDVDALAPPLRRILASRFGETNLAELPTPRVRIELETRTPYFCSGCPHSTSTQVPPGTFVGTGIGCHGMAGWMDPSRVGSVTGPTQMGGEGAQMIGIAPFVLEDHFVQNVGDGTYFHSAQLVVQAAVAAGTHMTFKLMFNSAVAMTGGQDAVGQLPVHRVAEILLAQGVSRIIVTTEDLDRYQRVRLPRGCEVWDRVRIIEAQELLRSTPGVTVLIHDQQCAAEARRLRKRGKVADPPQRIVIAQRVCEGCGDCGVVSNCLSVVPVATEFGTKRMIDQTSCNKDYSCLRGDCPSFLTVMPARRFSRRRRVAQSSRPGRQAPPRLELTDLPEPSPVTPSDMSLRMPGVGGTGVVTISQVLGTAATLAGLHVSTLDQTGLAQKGGPVVSDLRIQREPLDGSGRVESGGVDLYLVFDVIVGTSPLNLAGASPDRTVAVVSTTIQPTGKDVLAPGASLADLAPFRTAIDEATRSDVRAYVDAHSMTSRLFGSTAGANVFLLGVAYQLGAISIPAHFLEEALELNGVAVEMNIQAFRWGRLSVVDPERTARATAPGLSAKPVSVPLPPGLDLPPELLTLVTSRAGDLVAYQNRSLARRYLERLVPVWRAERAVLPGSTQLTEAFAWNSYKLTAYKDEYEVARLLLEEFNDEIVHEAVGRAPVRVSWNIHPPVLRALGLKHKIRLGAWFTPGFRLLRSLRRLRGTPFDLFGMTHLRRVERQLLTEYYDVMDRAIAILNRENYEAVTRLAGLPDMVRGYESIKLNNVEAYRATMRTISVELGLDLPDDGARAG